jgi:hypothetical protein
MLEVAKEAGYECCRGCLKAIVMDFRSDASNNSSGTEMKSIKEFQRDDMI